jgi:hypothetical protein
VDERIGGDVMEEEKLEVTVEEVDEEELAETEEAEEAIESEE